MFALAQERLCIGVMENLCSQVLTLTLLTQLTGCRYQSHQKDNDMLKHWLNGKSIEWIAKRYGVSPEKVTQVIQDKWAAL